MFNSTSKLTLVVCQVYISQLSISDMNRISLQLLAHATLAIAIPAIENDLVSQNLLGPEAGITDLDTKFQRKESAPCPTRLAKFLIFFLQIIHLQIIIWAKF